MQQSDSQQQQSATRALFNWMSVIALVYLILVAVGAVSHGFKGFSGGAEGAAQIFAFANNPFVALLLGILATALVQSSSTVTSVIVGLVAGGLPIGMAIPMVMGANLGTTITNTIVSLGHVRDRTEFRRAFAAATVHDFFNLLAVVIFLPLELMFGLLQHSAEWLANMLVGSANMSMKGMDFMKPLTAPAQQLIDSAVAFLPGKGAAIATIVIGILLILASVTYLGKVLQKVLVGRAKEVLHKALGRGPLSGITSGALVTIMVQSSSTTTSLMIPLAGGGVFSTRQLYPFTLGANIGTTITALLAATAISGAGAQLALTIALVHVLFNVFAVVFIYGLPFLRDLPVRAAEGLARVGSENKLLALGYVAGLFFALPALMMVAAK
ncbi:Na/Pi cotransporter family protein [Aeromonas jandaei]|uniref:Na/Pi cotransporter family protein n=1 Tax=Aeromonas TaxID=642 RepID=UPI001ADD6DFE|nr:MULTISPECIES: Na/Pi cotransporter family protein [Aeromonas]MBW3761742.1 Na/Pi cotransporter family protein [Aeromonas jandaei]MCQ4053920.1 Na/Pi cotransporter family protein [Aeromonas sp. SG16]QTL92710.1 Na+/Pi-cotransporter [Aeromonas jandaei]WAG08773.1 Na/Pi cotransporter family protein [Aeromonas jandaei]